MKVHDYTMRITKAFPAAGASANSDSVDLKAERASAVSRNGLEVHVTVPDLDNLAEGYDATISFEDSADDSSFAAIANAPIYTFTGGSGDGVSGEKYRFYLPPETRRYFRAVIAVETSGGDNTGDSLVVDFRI